MSKKVFEVAKELDMGAIELVEALKAKGLNVRNHMVKLSEEEVELCLKEFGQKPKVAEAKKKVTKKKVAKKKVAKKKVVKKVVKKASPTEEKKEDIVKDKPVETPVTAAVAETFPEETKPEVKAEVVTEEPTDASSKTVLVKKKSKVVKKGDRSRSSFAATMDSQLGPDENRKDNDDVFKEKMHSFTPVYIPKEAEGAQNKSNDSRRSGDTLDTPRQHGFRKVSDPVDETGDRQGKDSRKRMGDLASMVAKKAASKPKDLNTLRAEEELKFATSIVGKQIYTPVKRKKVYLGETKSTLITEVKDAKRVIQIHNYCLAKDLADKLSQKFGNLQNKALELNLLLKPEDYIGVKLANEIAGLYNYRAENAAFDEKEIIEKTAEPKKAKSDLPLRSPVVTIMGHVDHGKTTLIDALRSTSITEGEAGGITQHIGAYTVGEKDKKVTFLDTPGHAAFGAMRQRGANITDIVILIVAADDGVMPQTKESIKYAQTAGCPIIVAINKMDKEGANPERIKQELTEFSLVPEDWGGDTMFVPISALKKEGLDTLLESVHLQAEVMELRESPKGQASGIIIESKIESGRGPVSTVLVQKGTLKKGDALVVGESFGRARSLMDHSGAQLKEAGPSMPVQILGLNDVTIPGDQLNSVKNEREAKKIAENRAIERKKLESVEAPKVATLEDFFGSTSAEGEKRILKLIIRADVQGSYEAIKEALNALGNDEVGIDIVQGGVGPISDSDVNLAINAEAVIIGFNMRPVTSARRLADDKGIEVKTYSIIYKLIDDMNLALEGMLEPETIEKYIGRAEVRDTFNIPKVGTIGGCAVIDGKIERGCQIRLLRKGKIIHDGKLSTLKRFKDEVKEVANGYECGMALDAFNDIQVEDVFEAYLLEKKERKLESSI